MAMARQGVKIARAFFLWCLAAFAYSLGLVIGACATVVLWTIAAFIAGYKAARQ